MSDTIYALSSGIGRAAVAVIRVTGPRTRFVLETMAGAVPPPRRAVLRQLIDVGTGELLDEGLVLFFPGPRSYTGEDMAELQVHGGRAVVRSVLEALARQPGCRLADPGEFTRRALEHGRLDLARVEGIGDLVSAETAQQRRQALAQVAGLLSDRVETWRTALIDAMAELEAAIDFADEGDVQDHLALQRLAPSLGRLRLEIGDVLAEGRRGERVRDGFVVVIAGPPNAGKSTLLNALARRDVAIVSDVPGTTRDVLEVQLDVDGYPLVLLDTAGIRDTDDRVEVIGVERAVREARQADLVLWLSPAGQRTSPPDDWSVPLVEVATQIDSAPTVRDDRLGLSALTGDGVPELLRLLATRADQALGGEPAVVTRERHRLALTEAASALDRALAGLEHGSSPEIPAEDLRLAVRSLDGIIGRVDVEQVLDRLFAGFCIGK